MSKFVLSFKFEAEDEDAQKFLQSVLDVSAKMWDESYRQSIKDFQHGAAKLEEPNEVED